MGEGRGFSLGQFSPLPPGDTGPYLGTPVVVMTGGILASSRWGQGGGSTPHSAWDGGGGSTENDRPSKVKSAQAETP